VVGSTGLAAALVYQSEKAVWYRPWLVDEYLRTVGGRTSEVLVVRYLGQ